MSLRVSEKEFVKKIAPLVCIKGKKLKEMTATQTYQVLRDIGFIIVDEKVLREILKNYGGGLILNDFIRKLLGVAGREGKETP